MKTRALLLVFALAAAPLAPAQSPAPQEDRASTGLAPDGKRGFGMGLQPKDLRDLLRSKRDDDKAFLTELTELATSTRVQLLSVRKLYEDRGYFKFLPSSAGDDLAALHVEYAKCREAAARELGSGDARAKAFAAMLVDTRFNVRRELALRAEIAVEDLERARSVFGATVDGHVSLSAAELEHICARADLAAAELRAVRSDLEALKPAAGEEAPGQDELDARKKVLEVARVSDERARAAQLSAALVPRRELEEKMQKLLFSTNVEPKLLALRQWRERVLTAAAATRARTLELLPDTPEGDKARPEIARMKKTDRINQAFGVAIEGLANDPLDPELAWAAGHARQFSWPGLEGIAYFDRFLALSGIRTSDARPANGRKLTPREQEAYSAVVSFRH